MWIIIINKCEEFNIKFIVISEFSRNNDYYSFENPLSFKKIINNIYKEKLTEKCNIDNLCSKLKSFDFFNENEDNLILVYNELFHRKYNVNLMITPEIKQKLKQSYNNDKQFKNNKSIQILYDKDELKNEKRMKKAIKTINQLDFSKNRMNYYKNLK